MAEEKNTTVAALKKEMEEMRASYEEQLANLRAAKDKEEDARKKAQNLQRFLRLEEAYLNEYVEVKLFRDNDKYKDDVYVAINGKNCVVRRGEWTRIRRKFAMLLDQSEIQDLRTAELMAGESEKFLNASRARGM